ATRPVPTVPAAPVTFSTMTGCPREIRICSARIRARVSSGPPAASGTTIVTGRDGYGCVHAGLTQIAARTLTSNENRARALMGLPASDQADATPFGTAGGSAG